MLVLGVSASTHVLGLAVLRDGDPLCAQQLDLLAPEGARAPGHAEVLLLELDAMLQSARLSIRDVELVAVDIGPGTFGGVRIGIATAKALSLATETPLVGVCSLEAMADAQVHGFAPGTLLMPLLNAYRDEVYGAIYAREGASLVEIAAPFHLGAKDAAGRLNAIERPADTVRVVFGSGAYPYREALGLADQRRPEPSDATAFPSGLAIARLGLARFHANGPDNTALLEPMYVRPPDAVLNINRGS